MFLWLKNLLFIGLCGLEVSEKVDSESSLAGVHFASVAMLLTLSRVVY